MDKPKYQVDSDVPLPAAVSQGVPLNDLEVGQSIAFALKQRDNVQIQASRLKKRNGKVFTVRKESADRARVWRVK